MIARPRSAAMESRRALSLPVGRPEISCRKRFLRPCFSRVFSAADMGGQAPPRQRPLIMRRLRDRPGDPGRRLLRKLPLTPGPGLGAVLQTVRTPGLQILGRESTLMGADRPQHVLVLRGEVLETAPDRHPRRARGHERRSQFAYTTHRHTPPRNHRTTRHPSQRTTTIKVTHSTPKHPFPPSPNAPPDSHTGATTHSRTLRRQRLTTPTGRAGPLRPRPPRPTGRAW